MTKQLNYFRYHCKLHVMNDIPIMKHILLIVHLILKIPDGVNDLFSCSEVIDTVTHLYNAMEEQVHVLARKSNMSLQHLDFLLQLREMESRFTKVQSQSCSQNTNKKVFKNQRLYPKATIYTTVQKFWGR